MCATARYPSSACRGNFESASCQIQGESVGWWGFIIFIVASRRKTGLFSRVSGGSTRHVDVTSRHVNVTSYRGSTRHVVAAYRSVYRYRGSTRHVVADYQGTMPSMRLSVGKFLPSPIQSVPIPSTRFFFLFDYRICHCAHFDTSPPGAFGRNGFHGESA